MFNKSNIGEVIALPIICWMIIIQAGCKGPTGPDGEDAFIADSESPLTEWHSPRNGDSLYTTEGWQDTSVTLAATATDDKSIWRTVFYIGGLEKRGTLVDSAEGLYNVIWHYGLYPSGPYPLMARCWDEAGNMSTTRIIQVEVVRN